LAVSSTSNSWINGQIKRNVLAGQLYHFPVGSETSQELATLHIQKAEARLQNIGVIYNADQDNLSSVLLNGLEKQSQGKWAIQPNQGSAQFDLSLSPSQVYFSGEEKMLGKTSAKTSWSLVKSNVGIHQSQPDATVKETGIQSFGDFSIGRLANMQSNQRDRQSNSISLKPTLCLIGNEGKKFEIVGGNQGVSEIRVVGNDGKSFTQKVSPESSMLDFNYLPTGIYLIEMIDENGRRTNQRIVLRD